MSEYSTLIYRSAERIVRITLNRPDKRNALNQRMLEELCEAIERADQEREACVIVLRGAGDQAFCAGADLQEMAGGDGLLSQYHARGAFPRLFLAMERSSKITLAAINGHCLAGGFGLMMACDLAIAKSGIKLGTPEIARGLFPYMISALIKRAVPRRKAFEIMLLGDTFGPETALDLGMINAVAEPAAFDQQVEAWAAKIASFSPAVLGLGRRALVQQEGMPLEGAFAHLQGLLQINALLDDAGEGIGAFFEKRPPVWRGR